MQGWVTDVGKNVYMSTPSSSSTMANYAAYRHVYHRAHYKVVLVMWPMRSNAAIAAYERRNSVR